jgi:alkylation response protein AidB-like acyl-CoA dehydrogenase
MTTTEANAPTEIESVESFRARARTWLKANLPPARNAGDVYLRGDTEEEELAYISRARELQRTLFDGGFAGVCFPKEYGGLGLTPAHQEAFNEEVVGYELPQVIQVPTFAPCAAVLLEFGSEAQKQRHLPAILKGEEIWMQFLSEPSGGSDVAGALTTAVRDGDEWIVNGSKIWTTGAWFSDYGLCLLRTNWDVPKHRGLSVFIIKIHQPNIELHRIEMINGSREFCQEFMTDLRVASARSTTAGPSAHAGCSTNGSRSAAGRPTSPGRGCASRAGRPTPTLSSSSRAPTVGSRIHACAT